MKTKGRFAIMKAPLAETEWVFKRGIMGKEGRDVIENYKESGCQSVRASFLPACQHKGEGCTGVVREGGYLIL